MHEAKPIELYPFDDPQNPLKQLQPAVSQAVYLYAYLSVFNAKSVIEEPNYFDRDYLDEFTSFYGRSSQGYPNICRRLHFFSELDITKELLKTALGGDDSVIEQLQNNYLGFIILRPIPATPFGRTVLKWYPESTPNNPRVVNPSREYVSHIAGIPLKVEGIAWQQQDSAVGACATIGIWTMLHSSAFDAQHAIPTTAQITRAANKAFSLGARIFPSDGLTVQQLMGAIKEVNLAPVILSGDIQTSDSETGESVTGFSKERFASTCSAFLRSGYPVLIWGQHIANEVTEKHVICAVGFREPEGHTLIANEISISDSKTDIIYIHDDNLGPNVRFRIVDNGLGAPITIKTEPPEYAKERANGAAPTDDYPKIRPEMLFVAVHDELRTSPNKLHIVGLDLTNQLCRAINAVYTANGIPEIGLTFSTRFIRLSEYLGKELAVTLEGNADALSSTRMALCENVPPMSLHIGVIRIVMDNLDPLIDILYDTTDSDRNHPAYAHVIYDPVLSKIIAGATILGEPITAY